MDYLTQQKSHISGTYSALFLLHYGYCVLNACKEANDYKSDSNNKSWRCKRDNCCVNKCWVFRPIAHLIQFFGVCGIFFSLALLLMRKIHFVIKRGKPTNLKKNIKISFVRVQANKEPVARRNENGNVKPFSLWFCP